MVGLGTVGVGDACAGGRRRADSHDCFALSVQGSVTQKPARRDQIRMRRSLKRHQTARRRGQGGRGAAMEICARRVRKLLCDRE